MAILNNILKGQLIMSNCLWDIQDQKCCIFLRHPVYVSKRGSQINLDIWRVWIWVTSIFDKFYLNFFSNFDFSPPSGLKYVSFRRKFPKRRCKNDLKIYSIFPPDLPCSHPLFLFYGQVFCLLSVVLASLAQLIAVLPSLAWLLVVIQITLLAESHAKPHLAG